MCLSIDISVNWSVDQLVRRSVVGHLVGCHLCRWAKTWWSTTALIKTKRKGIHKYPVRQGMYPGLDCWAERRLLLRPKTSRRWKRNVLPSSHQMQSWSPRRRFAKATKCNLYALDPSNTHHKAWHRFGWHGEKNPQKLIVFCLVSIQGRRAAKTQGAPTLIVSPTKIVFWAKPCMIYWNFSIFAVKSN